MAITESIKNVFLMKELGAVFNLFPLVIIIRGETTIFFKRKM